MRVAVIAPHADDESIGPLGTLLKLQEEFNAELHWILCSDMARSGQYTLEEKALRSQQVKTIAERIGFKSFHQGTFEPSKLDAGGLLPIVSWLSDIIRSLQPSILLVPFRYDAHSDHKAIYDASMACTKSFRYPSIEQVLAYETLSETNFQTHGPIFNPNLTVDISKYLSRKLEILSIYHEEFGSFPFPRSLDAVEHLARLRGVRINALAAEAFEVQWIKWQ